MGLISKNFNPQSPPKNATEALDAFFSGYGVSIKPKPASFTHDGMHFQAKLYITDENDKPLLEVIEGVNEPTWLFLAEKILGVEASAAKENESDIADMTQEILNIFAGNAIKDFFDEQIYLLTPPEPIAASALNPKSDVMIISYLLGDQENHSVLFAVSKMP
ncbi:MAG: hypothetical protein D6767_06325 [Candidatus Hydrogenedentota bacterium]|nr:MAG: hypothetical protein D6767_06325 [Candidatus Hydrogenedentota bacterium]